MYIYCPILLHGVCVCTVFYFVYISCASTGDIWRSLRKLQRKSSAIRKRWRSIQLTLWFKCPLSCQLNIVLARVKYLASLTIFLSSSVGLRLWRRSTAESGRRTGEPKTGPRALRAPALQRAHHQSHLRKKQHRPQRPRVLVRTPERIFVLKCMIPLFTSEPTYLLFTLPGFHLICPLFLMHALCLSLSLSLLCAVLLFMASLL